MLLRTSPALLVVLLAACQSAAGPFAHTDRASEQLYWQEQAESRQANLEREFTALRALVTARGLPASGATPPAMDSEAVLQLTASLTAMADRLEQWQPGAQGDVGPMDASHTAAPALSSGGQRTAALEALKNSLLALEERHAIHCENIANIDVPGYKRRRLQMQTLRHGPDDLRTPHSQGDVSIMTQGVMELTGNELDFAVEGEGFFEVMLPTGELRYVRNGAFRQDFSGRIVTPEGNLLTDQVSIPPDSQGISVSSDGQVFALEPENTIRAIGAIRLHVFASEAALKPASPHGFVPTKDSGQPQARQPGIQGCGSIRQGYLERANVELSRELIDLQLVEQRVAAVRQALALHGIYAR